MAYSDPSLNWRTIFANLSEFEQDFVEAEAAAQGISVSELMTEIIRDELRFSYGLCDSSIPVVH